MDVHLDHAGVGGDGEVHQPRIVRRQIAFQHHLAADFRRRFPRSRRVSASQSSTANSGGRNTCIRPSRGSHASAVRTRSRLAAADHRQFLRHRAEAFDAAACRPSVGSRRCRTPGAAAAVASARRGRVRPRARSFSGSAQGRLSSGRRRPIGRVAGDQEHLAGAEEPVAGLPAPRAVVDAPGAAAARCRPRWPGPGRTPAPAGRVPARRAAWRPRRARWRAGGARARGSSGCPRRPG